MSPFQRLSPRLSMQLWNIPRSKDYTTLSWCSVPCSNAKWTGNLLTKKENEIWRGGERYIKIVGQSLRLIAAHQQRILARTKKGTRSSWCHSPHTAGNSSRANSAHPIAFQWSHLSGSKGGVPILVERARGDPQRWTAIVHDFSSLLTEAVWLVGPNGCR